MQLNTERQTTNIKVGKQVRPGQCSVSPCIEGLQGLIPIQGHVLGLQVLSQPHYSGTKKLKNKKTGSMVRRSDLKF